METTNEKRGIQLYFDREIINLAKSRNMNISLFCENALRQHLALFPTGQSKEQLQKELDEREISLDKDSELKNRLKESIDKIEDDEKEKEELIEEEARKKFDRKKDSIKLFFEGLKKIKEFKERIKEMPLGKYDFGIVNLASSHLKLANPLKEGMITFADVTAYLKIIRVDLYPNTKNEL